MDSIQVKKLLIILITSLVWDINFRLTFKNVDAHMDLVEYPSLKYDPFVILIKNILSSIIFLSLYFISKKLSASQKKPNNNYLKVKTRKTLDFNELEKTEKLESFLGQLAIFNNLDTKNQQILFCIKTFLLILFIYLIEENYFIFGNTHILDRVNVPMRNVGILFTILIFSSLLIKKEFNFYKHQLIPSLIFIVSSLFIIIFDGTTTPRFKKLYSFLNIISYMIIYLLMGIEIVLIKYLIDIQYINPFIILFIKGVIGTIIFIIINIIFNNETFFNLIDKFIPFLYDNMIEEFNFTLKLFYIITILILQYLKIFIIKEYSESHFLIVAMIADLLFFPLYLIEKFGIQKFEITTSSVFYLNLIFEVINTFLLLVFNEIIELKFCGLNINLNKNIEERNNSEMNLTWDMKINDDNDIDNYIIDFEQFQEKEKE